MKIKLSRLYNCLKTARKYKARTQKNIILNVKYKVYLHQVLNRQNSEKIVVKKESKYQLYYFGSLICNEQRIYKFLHSCPDLVYTSSFLPELLHFDESHSRLIYKYQADYINLESYYEKHKIFPVAIATLIGTTLAKIHCETMNCQNCYDFMNEKKENKFCYQFPYPSYLLDKIEPETLKVFPAEGWRFIAFYQGTEIMKKAIRELVAHHRHCCLTHNNPQLSKILIHAQWEGLLSQCNYSDISLIKLIDWERCSWGDPACDLGTVIAGYLLLWLNSITVHPTIELEISLQLATIPLEAIRPSIQAMTINYIMNYSNVLKEHPEFIKRTIQFAGLSLIYQLLERIQSQNILYNQGICLLQIAKKLLCQPEKSFESIFGLTESKLIETIAEPVHYY